MNIIEKIQEFIKHINSDYFWREQLQVLPFVINYYMLSF